MSSEDNLSEIDFNVGMKRNRISNNNDDDLPLNKRRRIIIDDDSLVDSFLKSIPKDNVVNNELNESIEIDNFVDSCYQSILGNSNDDMDHIKLKDINVNVQHGNDEINDDTNIVSVSQNNSDNNYIENDNKCDISSIDSEDVSEIESCNYSVNSMNTDGTSYLRRFLDDETDGINSDINMDLTDDNNSVYDKKTDDRRESKNIEGKGCDFVKELIDLNKSEQIWGAYVYIRNKMTTFYCVQMYLYAFLIIILQAILMTKMGYKDQVNSMFIIVNFSYFIYIALQYYMEYNKIANGVYNFLFNELSSQKNRNKYLSVNHCQTFFESKNINDLTWYLIKTKIESNKHIMKHYLVLHYYPGNQLQQQFYYIYQP